MSKRGKLPDVVYPCGKAFKVEFGPISCPDTYGETHGIEKVIKLSDNKDKKKHSWSTLYHEYIHAIFHCTGLSELLSAELEEAVVVAIEEHTFHLIESSKLAEKP
jgi:hypothetical protein